MCGVALDLFCKFEPAKQGDCHLVAVIDANVGNDLMEQLLVEHLQRLFQLVDQGFQVPHVLQHRRDPRFKAAAALYFQLTELLTEFPRLYMVNVSGEVSLRAQPLQCEQFCIQFRDALAELAGRSVVPLIGCGGKFKLLNRLTEDIFFAEAQLVDHGDDAVINAFFAVIAGIAGIGICRVFCADPLDYATSHLPVIERAALGTPNAAGKRISVLSSFPFELISSFPKQHLH